MAARALTITFVLPFVNLTGGIRVLLDYSNHLQGAGHAVTVMYPLWPYRFQLTREQQWHEFRKQLRAPVVVPWFDLRCRLLRVPFVHRAFTPPADLVIAAAWPAVRDVARLPARCGRKVHIVMHHESGTGPEARIQSIYRLPFHRIAFSRFVKESITSRFGCPIADVVPNGVDTSVFFPDGQPAPATVLFLYHPDPRKGADDGIRALERLRARRPGIRVRVIGTVHPDVPLPAWMPFEFHPVDAVLRQAYSQATLLLYPSRYEGFGLPPLEGMACGCPSVTTSVGAVPEFAVDRVTSMVVPPGDVDAMVDRMDEVLADRALRDQLAANGLAAIDRWALARVAPLFERALVSAANNAAQTRMASAGFGQ